MTWRCTWCGRVHDRENEEPPASCATCGRDSFEAVDDESAAETVETGTQFVWVCPNCGRDHVKNNPPCSRCLNPTLERAEPDHADLEADLDVPSWLEVMKPYAPVLVVAVVIVALFATGIIPASILPGIGTDVPGEADSSNGIDHATVEAAVHDQLNAHRSSIDEPERGYDDGVAAYAEAQNQRLVIERYTDREPSQPDPSQFDTGCIETLQWGPIHPLEEAIEGDEYDSETALAEDIAAALLESPFAETVETGAEREGLDVHVGPDGDLSVVYATCT